MLKAVRFAEATALHPQTAKPVVLARARTKRFRHFYGENLGKPVEKQLAFDLPDELLWELNAQWRCWSDNGFIFSPDGSVILDAFSFPEQTELFRYLGETGKTCRPQHHQHLQGDVFVWTNVGATNYFHVVSELMPRLQFLEGYPNARLLVPRMLPTFATDMLSSLGFSERLIPIESFTVYTADRMLVTGWGLNFIPERYNWLRDKYSGFKRVTKTRRKIYVERTKGFRTLQNQVEVRRLFEAYHFETVQAEVLSIQEQVELFSQAEIIAGPHGAGFTNTIWMNAPFTVLEIRPEGWDNRSLYHHALASGCSQYHVIAAKIKEPGQIMNPDLVLIDKVLKTVT
jgi:capsular polysaccharide biosynthesis protein